MKKFVNLNNWMSSLNSTSFSITLLKKQLSNLDEGIKTSSISVSIEYERHEERR